MRTLTQVWVFLLSLSFLFLLLSFQLLGRAGLFIAFILSLLFLYAALRNTLRLFTGFANPHLFCGNDPSGFLKTIEINKLKFGFRKIEVHTTSLHTPPLIWKNKADHGYILINEKLIEQLSKDEVRLLALYLLCQLELRSFVLAHILSTVKIPIVFLSVFSKITSTIAHKFAKTQQVCLEADLKFMTVSETTKYEVGYFLNRLYKINLNVVTKPNSSCFFSVLGPTNHSFINESGIPHLAHRQKKIMGFAN